MICDAGTATAPRGGAPPARPRPVSAPAASRSQQSHTALRGSRALRRLHAWWGAGGADTFKAHRAAVAARALPPPSTLRSGSTAAPARTAALGAAAHQEQQGEQQVQQHGGLRKLLRHGGHHGGHHYGGAPHGMPHAGRYHYSYGVGAHHGGHHGARHPGFFPTYFTPTPRPYTYSSSYYGYIAKQPRYTYPFGGLFR